ncbi:MAG: hypothetical protein Q4G04_01360 [bacterium]|nr:hypothetical protein [bacterium]
MSIKKKCLIVVLFLIVISGIFIVINNKDKTELKSNNKTINKQETIVEEKKEQTKDIIEDEVKEEKQIEEKETKKVEEKSTKEKEKNNDNNAIEKPIKEETIPVVEDKKEEAVQTPTCTPKKFVWSWVVPEFTSEESCVAKGNTFTPEYGFQCDSYQDDCGDYYYMLKLFDDNSSLIDWHTIEN